MFPFYVVLMYTRTSLMVQMVKNLPATQETWVPSLDWEDSLEKGMATHSSVLAWRVPWTDEPGRLRSPWACKESDPTKQLHKGHVCDECPTSSKRVVLA